MQTPVIYITSVYSTIEEKEQKKKKNRVGSGQIMSHYMKATRKHFSKNIHEFIIRPLLRQRETGELCDVTLKLRGERFASHKAILSLWSPYFLSMFTCDMKEKTTREVDLSESLSLQNDGVFASVLDYIYTGTIALTLENVEDVLRIADFLLLDDVKDFCRQFYLDLGNLDLNNCLRVRFLAEDHCLYEVKEYCQKIIEARFHDYLIFHDDILELSVPCLLVLLENPAVVQHTRHKDLKKLIQRWVEYDSDNRKQFYDELNMCIKVWVCDFTNEASYLGRDLARTGMASLWHSYHGSIDEIQGNNKLMEASAICTENSSHAFDLAQQVLLAVVWNQGMKFFKLLVYNISEQKWYFMPIAKERLLQLIPPRQTLCNVLANNNFLYIYLCSSFPYPTDMLKINVLAVDLQTQKTSLYSFRTVDYYNPSYRTTLTNYRTVPPAIVYCNNNCFVIGNKEGTGHLFLCNLQTHLYTCYHIPGSRIISLARAVVKSNQYIFLWYRHRTGPSEEFCIRKSVGFAMFDAKTKQFSSWDIPPPDISYDDFARPYIMCIREETVFVYLPGKPALVLDETRCKWITSLRRIPVPGSFSDHNAQLYGYQLQVSTSHSIFVLNNEAPYTTTVYEVSETLPMALAHTPPPIDHISMVTSGLLSSSILSMLESYDKYDETYSSALQMNSQVSEGDTEESGTSNDEEQESDNNDYEYDEDFYGYNLEMEVGLEF